MESLIRQKSLVICDLFRNRDPKYKNKTSKNLKTGHDLCLAYAR
jgi:hypothetical protein